jgi:hypothetical protein
MNEVMNKPWFRVIGDVHGHYDDYVAIAKEAEYTLQLGDLGFEYDCLKKLDPDRHKVLAGNHENYDKWGTTKFIHMQTGHWLGDFGVHTVPEFGEIFFVRGGFSIDFMYRKEGRDWFRNDEELSMSQMYEALQLYIDTKPEFMFSHECPGELANAAWGDFYWDGVLVRPSKTAQLLEKMWSAHSPKYWFFGHHHKAITTLLRGTTFCCVPELGHVDLDKNKEIVAKGAGIYNA